MSDSDTTRGIAILGSTGSIGTQALDVIREQEDRLHVEVLSAHRNADLLIAQALEFRPNAVVIGQRELFQEVNATLFDEGIKVYAGPEALEQVVEMEGVEYGADGAWLAPLDCGPPCAPSEPAKTLHLPTKRHSLWQENW